MREKLLLLFIVTLFIGCNNKEECTLSRTQATHMLEDVWMRDPYIYLHDGKYYLTYTNSYMEMPIWESTDLATWTKVTEGYTMRKLTFFDKIQDVRDKLNKEQKVYYDGEMIKNHSVKNDLVKLWAPEIYNIDGRWISVHTSNSVTSVILASDDISFDNITEPMEDKFGRHHDPSIFTDTDGTHWLVDRCAQITKLKNDFTGFDGTPISINPSDRKMGHEGCQIIKVDGKYVWFGTAWSNDELRNGTYNLYYATSDKIEGPYSERRFAGYCLGHGTVFKDKHGKWWCTAFKNGESKLEGNNRALTINKQGLTLVPLTIEKKGNDIFVNANDPKYSKEI